MTALRAVAWLAAAAASWFLVGWLGVLACMLTGLAVLFAPRVALAAAVVAPVLLAILTLTEAETDAGGIRVFAAARPISHGLGMVTVVIWFGAAIAIWRRAEPIRAEEGISRDRRRWVLLLFVAVALAGTALTID